MRSSIRLTLILLFGCTATTTPFPTPEILPPPGPLHLEVEVEYLFVFCEMEERCRLEQRLHYLASGAISFSGYDTSDVSRPNPRFFNWISYPDGSTESRNCEYVAEINSQLYCSNLDRTLPPSSDQSYRVSLVADEGPYWHIDTPFFIGCDPDGDGEQGICTGTGIDQPPFDGVQERQWYGDETGIPRWGMDRPGYEPLFWREGFFGEPEIASILAFARPSRLNGESVLLGIHEGFLSVAPALPPYTVQHLLPRGVGQNATLGRFLPGYDELVLVFGGAEGSEMELYSFDGELVATADVDIPLRRSGPDSTSRIAFDIDGDGLDELIWEDGVSLLAIHFPALVDAF